MIVRRRLFHMIVLLLVLGLVLAACERPIPGGSGNTETVTPDPNVGGGEPASDDTSAGVETSPEPAPAESEEGDTPRTEEEAAATPEPAAEENNTSEEDTNNTEEEATTEEAEAGSEESTTEEDAAEEVTNSDSAAETPATHIVQPGENLYRIGLQYGISWVKLAEYNGLSNPNLVKVGQELKLTAGGSDGGDPTVTPSPLTETTYIVKAGDNLFRIGLAYGISWVQIAEANGIINPNKITVGDSLKIPVSTPGPTPDFTHLVRPRETLFLISLRYGVPWTSIAEKNDIQSPYVIYVGQTLIIPGD